MSENTDRKYTDLLFDVRRSVRYHRYRQAHFEFLRTGVVFAGLILGSSTIAVFGEVVGGNWPLWAKLLPAALVTVLSALDLVFRFSDRAWRHADLARRFIDLERQLETNRALRGEELDDLLEKITDQRLLIEIDEPRVLRVLDTLCYNELLRAMGYPRGQQIRVGYVQKFFAQFVDIGVDKMHVDDTLESAK